MAKDDTPEPKLPTVRLNGILAAARKDCHWTLREAKYAELWYKRFLFLSLHNGRKPVYGISKKSDCLWHTHILDTKRYRADCQRIFGQYLDHTPTAAGSKKVKNAKLARAKALYVKYFGASPPDIAIKCY